MIFNLPFLKSLKIGDTIFVFKDFLSITEEYSLLARLTNSSFSTISSLKKVVTLFFQNSYRFFESSMVIFVPISNLYA